MNPLAGLARFTRAVAPARPPVPLCEICSQPIAPTSHRHALALEPRTIACVCAACALLFDDRRAGARYRTIGTRVAVDPGFRLDGDAFTRLGIPVRLAFLFCEAGDGDVAARQGWQAVYPSAGGATAAPLAPGAVAALGDIPLARTLLPLTEALVLHGRQLGARPRLYLAPIDRCYELVGLLRQTWRGFSGGDEAWRAVDGFFAALDAAAAPMRPEGHS